MYEIYVKGMKDEGNVLKCVSKSKPSNYNKEMKQQN